MRARRPVPVPDTTSTYVPAPIGGFNSIDVATLMPPTDSIYAFNLLPAEYGLRARLGYREWVTNIAAVTPSEVRTIIPFTGTAQNGSTDKLFAAAPDGIYDCTNSFDNMGNDPIPAQFGVKTGDSGYGVSTVMTTPAGRFLIYTDEENGLWTYKEGDTYFIQAAAGVAVLWKFSTAYFVGDKVQNGGNVYVATVAGTSAASSGPSGTGTGIVDGGVTWNYVSASVANAIGPSLADQRAGFGGLPANFAAVCVWKNRVWLVEKNSTRAWYLGINAVFGEATSFDFGSKMKAGGPLVNLYNWSYDGGSGMDTLLVGISTAGDVVIYQGTDPSSINSFSLKGCWSLGGVPYGRRIATDNGGDILILSTVGIIPLSKLVVGKIPAEASDKDVYATAKISNLFNVLVSGAKSLRGWALHVHPTDNALIVLIPTQAGQQSQQLAMSFATRGWARYRDLPMYSAGVWNGQLYFGDAQRVCINTGYVDNVNLAGTAYTPVQWSLLTGYTNLGNANAKKVELIRPELISEGSNPVVEAQAFYDLNMTEPAPPTSGVASGGGSAWGSAVWDTATWGGAYSPSAVTQGALGFGRSVAIAARGSAVARTVVTGFHVMFREGGLL